VRLFEYFQRLISVISGAIIRRSFVVPILPENAILPGNFVG
jgi:hypothetical protein